MEAFVLVLGSKGTESESQGSKYSFQASGPKKGDLNPLIVCRLSLSCPSPMFMLLSWDALCRSHSWPPLLARGSAEQKGLLWVKGGRIYWREAAVACEIQLYCACHSVAERWTDIWILKCNWIVSQTWILRWSQH